MNLNELARTIFEENHPWWHDADGKPIQRNTGELIALMHSELSEALEADRKQLWDDKLPHRSGIEVELADCIIRILDYCGAHALDIHGAITEKRAFNQQRIDHTHEHRAGENGKKY